MFRFVMPDPKLSRSVQLELLRGQFEAFLNSDALAELFDLLGVDGYSFCRIYNGRRNSDGRVLETQVLDPVEALNEHRDKIYPLLDELGFFTINKPLEAGHSHIVVLGGSLEACYDRTRAAKQWMSSSVSYVDGLACFRPIHPRERVADLVLPYCETEFGAMTESFASVFSLPRLWEDDFHSDRNLNNISCVRSFSDVPGDRRYRVFAAPSTVPQVRRADTGDSFFYYLHKTKICCEDSILIQQNRIRLSSSDSLLFLTNNRYCNRQFIQLAWYFMKLKVPIRFDIIGCTPDERVVSRERYDAYQFFQDLIGVLNWIERFYCEFL